VTLRPCSVVDNIPFDLAAGARIQQREPERTMCHQVLQQNVPMGLLYVSSAVLTEGGFAVHMAKMAKAA